MNFSRSFFVSPSNVATTALDFTQAAIKALHCLTLRPAASIYTHTYISDPGNTDANVTHKQKTHGVGPLQLTALLRITIFSPLTTHNLVLPLLTHFLALFSTLPQILYRAFILRYRIDILQNQVRPFAIKPQFGGDHMTKGMLY